jgi:hypothetical protein
MDWIQPLHTIHSSTIVFVTLLFTSLFFLHTHSFIYHGSKDAQAARGDTRNPRIGSHQWSRRRLESERLGCRRREGWWREKNVVCQIREFAMPEREGTQRKLERETGGEPRHPTAPHGTPRHLTARHAGNKQYKKRKPARQPQIRDNSIESLRRNPSKSFEKVAADIDCWASGSTIQRWFARHGGVMYAQRALPLLTAVQRER